MGAYAGILLGLLAASHGLRAAFLGVLDAWRGDGLYADNLCRIACHFGLALGIHEIIFRGDFVPGSDKLVALCGVAGIGIGSVLGLDLHAERNQFVRLVCDVCCRGTPADESKQTVDLIRRRHLAVADRNLFVDYVLANLQLHVGFAAVILVDGDAATCDSRHSGTHDKFFHSTILLVFVFDVSSNPTPIG